MAQEPFFQKLFSKRIGGENYGKDTKIYKFERIKRAKREAISRCPDIKLLDFGIGENDDMAHELVRSAMKKEIDDIENRGYADNGIQEYKAAVSRFMFETFGVILDPETQVNHTIGSKSALAILPYVFIDPGDVTLMTVPGYPVAGTHTMYAGGEVYPMKLEKKNGFLPRLDQIPQDIINRAKLMVVNYPNSPTGAVAPVSFWNELVAFAREEKIVAVNDAAHSLLAYKELTSYLQTPGAMDVGIEIHSMSKGFNMIGWRLGFIAGNKLIVRAVADVKDNCDSGQFKAIQKASCVAISNKTIHEEIRAKYKRRLEKLVNILKELGFEAEMPGGSYFLYVKAPVRIKGREFKNAEEAAEHLLRNYLVLTVPWDDAGAYLRFSATYMAAGVEEEDSLMKELKNRLRDAELEFN